MSAHIHSGQLLEIGLASTRGLTVQVILVLFDGTSSHVSALVHAWRELLIVDTSAGIVLRDRVREHLGGHDRTISCDWQMFPDVDVCSAWLEPANKLEARARAALARRAA